MLNISKNSVISHVHLESLESSSVLNKKAVRPSLLRVLTILTGIFIFSLFLPWTQNIRSSGYVTTLSPDDRPQSIQALIGGRIEQWYVREGQYVNAGDTIIKISEVKEEYLDPQLLERTVRQIESKSLSADAYDTKSKRLAEQYLAIKNTRDIKLEQNDIKITQLNIKLVSDSMNVIAAKLDESIAEQQLLRTQELYDRGIKSLTELETRKLKYQENKAKRIALENILEANNNELLNLASNVVSITAEYDDKMAKT